MASTPAEAAEVNTNFTNLVTFLNNSVVHKDGSKTMTGALAMGSQKVTGLANGTVSTDAVNKGQLDARTPYLSVNVSGTEATSTSGPNIITFDTETTDVDSIAGASTVTIGTAGWYGIRSNCSINTAVIGNGGGGGGDSEALSVYLYLDGAQAFTLGQFTDPEANTTSNGATMQYLPAGSVLTFRWEGVAMANNPTLTYQFLIHRMV